MVELPPKTGDTLLHKKVQGFLAGMELKPNFPQCEFGARNQKPSGLRFAPSQSFRSFRFDLSISDIL